MKTKIDFRKMKLTAEERRIESEIERGEWAPAAPEEQEKTLKWLARYRKDAVLSIRVNSQDLAAIKKKAKRAGVPYQKFISEIIHRLAE